MIIIDAYTSDPHYGHRRIIEYCNRPFTSIDHMKSELISRYNRTVSTNQLVLWGGDCFFCPVEEAKEILQSLNGRKILILGNHDKSAGTMSAIGFDIVMDECVLTIAGQTVRVKHYPYNDRRFPDRCPRPSKHEMLIHGHTHSPEKINGKQIHIGVDAWDYTPATAAQIEELVIKHGNKQFNSPNG